MTLCTVNKVERVQKTLSAGFCWELSDSVIDVAASPSRPVSIEELMETAKGVTNMALAHEIVVNGDFQIKPAELPEHR